jgi:hypothetical protein
MMQHTAYSLKEKLEEANLRLPLLDRVDESAINQLINIQVRERAATVGAKHGMKYAEEFHYVPVAAEGSYVMKNAVPLN